MYGVAVALSDGTWRVGAVCGVAVALSDGT